MAGRVETANTIEDLKVDGRIMYAAAGEDGLRIIDVYGDFAYVSHYFGLSVFDISEPAAPVEIASLSDPTTWYFYDLKAHAGHAFVAQRGNRGGLRIFDVTQPSDPKEVANGTLRLYC